MKNVLIVDDDLGFQRLLGISLKKYKQDFDIILSNNGEEAIGVLNRKPVDLIITDLQMPKIDGLTLLAYINDAFPKIPCVIMTAHSTPDIEKQFAQTGQLLLKKPFTINKLVDAIQTALKPRSDADGVLKGISVANFLQMIALEQKTCLLEISTSDGKKGFFYIENGEVFDAAFHGLTGEEAAYALIGTDGASIRFTNTSTKKVKKRIQASLMALIMEAMTRKDETIGSP